MRENESRPVVVGVDGSVAARAALDWAVEDARRRGCRVDVICAWHPDYGGMIGPLPGEVWREIAPEALRRTARKMVRDAVRGFDGVEIRQIVVEGDAKTVLTEASEEAGLLVVGSRGLGPIAELVLGSVSSYCVHHASCPVVVVRGPTNERVREERPARGPALPLTPGPLL